MREATFDQADCSFNANLLRTEEQMNVVWHDYEGVQLVVSLAGDSAEEFRGRDSRLLQLEISGGD
jgi:hypothetical protein